MIQVYPDLETLSRAAASLVAAQARSAVAARGRFGLALAGGGTPRRTYELLAGIALPEQVPWDRIHVFWGDERCVPLDDPRSNYGMAAAAWLDRAPIPRSQIYPLHCGADPEAAARQYEAQLQAYLAGGPPRLDLVLLGLGVDGHTASLFPGAPALEETARWTAAVYLADQNLWRVTLTAPFINQARLIVFLVAGPSKAAVLRQVLHGSRNPRRLPAQLIEPADGELVWLTDLAAAALLPRDRCSCLA